MVQWNLHKSNGHDWGAAFWLYRGGRFVIAFLLQMNLGALLTASLAHTSLKGCRDKTARLSRLCKKECNNFLLILGVAVRSEKLFSIAKADQGLESYSLYGV